MQLIEHIKSASDRRTFLERLTEVHEWQPQFGKVGILCVFWCSIVASISIMISEFVYLLSSFFLFLFNFIILLKFLFSSLQSEMARWSDVLNMCDEVLKDAVTCSSSPGAPMAIDEDQNLISDVTSVLSFTAMLFENTFTRSVYSSIDVSIIIKQKLLVPRIYFRKKSD